MLNKRHCIRFKINPIEKLLIGAGGETRLVVYTPTGLPLLTVGHGHHHSSSPNFSCLLGRNNTLAGTETERLPTICSGCLVLHTDGDRNKNPANRTMSQEGKIRPNVKINSICESQFR